MRKELALTREGNGFTKAQMANELGISRSFYGLIENGVRNPDYGLAERIAELLKVSPESIFFDLDNFRMNQRKIPQSTKLVKELISICRKIQSSVHRHNYRRN